MYKGQVSLLSLDDTIFEADIATNRPDCLSMIGVAREACATFNKELKITEPVVRGDGEDINDYLKVTVLDKQLCQRYCARIVTDIKVERSPQWMVDALRSVSYTHLDVYKRQA